MKKPLKILVIRLGALGDFVQSFYPFAAIRKHHINDHITLLTTSPFAELAQQSPWFNQVVLDHKPHLLNIIGFLKLKKLLQGYDLVYDLQTSRRSTRYFCLAGRPLWSGIAKKSPYFHNNPNRNNMHTLDRQKDQLQYAGIQQFPEPDLSWFMDKNVAIDLPRPYAILVPGCSIKRLEKRWPVEHYAEIAQLCMQRGVHPVLAGGAAELELGQQIKIRCPQIFSLIGQTTLLQLGAVMTHAQFALGNDTGLMHIAAMVGCPSVVLFSSASNPSLTAPQGKSVKILYQADLTDLSVKKVAQELNWVH
ncbi:glycosyltransferase family 9 protein [Commensalibacter oyaizuii]|uniref:Glycosyltransferase family 9 protein n=1 Tax=Commensalibacter oyaizuii TaxID=3043873 RepID=A0ABT6Q0S9_9PROT|nr:glycosyltransferase family 9 protein [Commensalibacter sp. TBRC 16381]MDI2090588.1 glycosyltransferase family 9 protein [Commensalibacter sp. TBRC 16381]